MFAPPVLVATTVGGQAYCVETEMKAAVATVAFWFIYHSVYTFITVVSMETWCTFAGVGVMPPSAGCSVLAGGRQAVIYRCKQEVEKDLSKQFNIHQVKICHLDTFQDFPIRAQINSLLSHCFPQVGPQVPVYILQKVS